MTDYVMVPREALEYRNLPMKIAIAMEVGFALNTTTKAKAEAIAELLRQDLLSAAPPMPTREAGEPIEIDYTNWRGERGVRRILPLRIEWGSNEWHKEPGWLLVATDLDNGTERTFALNKSHRFGDAPAREAGLREALVNTLASLAAAISLLEDGGRIAAASDKIFSTMLADYRKALAEGRAALSQQQETGWRLPEEPPPGLLMSMALRYDHGLGCAGFYDRYPRFEGDSHAKRLEATLTTMRQLYEEVAGHGFYRPAKEAEYVAMKDGSLLVPPAEGGKYGT